MIDVLEKLFSSAALVKIMRLFLFNTDTTFDFDQIVNRCKVTPQSARYELTLLQKVGLIKKRSFFKDHTTGSGKKKKVERRRVAGWTINAEFEYIDPLQTLLVGISPLRPNELLRRLHHVGKLKLVIISGLFIQNWDSRIDLLVVGEGIRKATFENTIKTLESEIGREIRYAYFETADFLYRLGMYDKLIRDVLDYPHERILDKVDVMAKKP